MDFATTSKPLILGSQNERQSHDQEAGGYLTLFGNFNRGVLPGCSSTNKEICPARYPRRFYRGFRLQPCDERAR